MFPDMIRSQLVFSEDQHLGLYVCKSWGTIICMGGINCYAWNFRTGDPLMLLSLWDLIIPFPPLHSSIVQATASWYLRTLVRHDEGTWYSQPRRDWPSLPNSVLQDILSYVDCKEEFHAFAHTCKSWYLASSLYPRPLLLHPFACPTWLFVTPGGRCNNAVDNFRLFPALRMEEQSSLIGGSKEFLIFVDQSVCSIINIHTGKRTEIRVPCLGVLRGVLSAPADSPNCKILLVTGTSVLCKSVNDTDEWSVQDFGDMRQVPGPIDDIVFVGETAYLIDNRSRLFVISPVLEIRFRDLADFDIFPPLELMDARQSFGRGVRSAQPKLIVHKNWLMEHHGQLLRLFLMSCTLRAKVRFGFFLSRIGSNIWYKHFKDQSERMGLHFPSKKFPAEAWIEMRSADLGDSCLFLNNGTCVMSFVADNPGRWGLETGQVFVCGPEIFPWLSFDFDWAREGDVIPENIRWPCPLFMDSRFSFTAAEELDHRILRAKAPEPTALNLDSTAMSGNAGDDLLASDADKVLNISNSGRLEHLAGSVGFEVEAPEPDRLPCFLASADATQSGRPRRLPASVEVRPTPEVSDPESLEHLGGTVGLQGDSITGSDRLPRLLASPDANLPEVRDPYGLGHLAGMLAFHVKATTDSYHLLTAADLKTNLTICEGEDGANSLLGDTFMFPDLIRSRLVFSEDQHLGLYVSKSWGTIIYMDGSNCYTWNFRTGDPLMLLPLGDLIVPFPPLHSGIVQATASWSLRTLVRYDEGTWYSQPRRDWPSLPDSVLQDILSYADCKEDFHSFAYTCKSWFLVSSLYPRLLLLHTLATPTWLFVTPGGTCNNAVDNFRLFPALRMEEHSTLIGGSTKFLIFVDQSVCSIINIHTGNRTELLVPCLGVQRGVLSAPADCANSKILLVTGTSVLCKFVNGTDKWRVQDFGDIRVVPGPVDDVVFIGETAYLIDNRSRLFVITHALEISFWVLEDFDVFPPPELSRHVSQGYRRGGRGVRSAQPKLIVRKNWLLERHGQLLRLILVSCTLRAKVRFGFFLLRIGSNRWYKHFKNQSERMGLHFQSKKFPAEAWIEMRSADLGDSCLFLNSGTCVTSFIADNPGRWGLESGQVFVCGPEIFPWLSFDFDWARKGDVIPENIRWPCPVFMDSHFSFTAAEELDHRILRAKAPEPTALNLDSAAASSGTFPSEARDLSFIEEAS